MTLRQRLALSGWLNAIKVALGFFSAGVIIRAGLGLHLENFSWRTSLIELFRLAPATTNPYHLNNHDFTIHRIAYNLITKPGLFTFILLLALAVLLLALALFWLIVRFSNYQKPAAAGAGSVPVKGVAGVVYQRALKPVGDREYDLYQAVVRL